MAVPQKRADFLRFLLASCVNVIPRPGDSRCGQCGSKGSMAAQSLSGTSWAAMGKVVEVAIAGNHARQPSVVKRPVSGTPALDQPRCRCHLRATGGLSAADGLDHHATVYR